MDTLTNIIFFINMAWIATHELDAIQRHEWRIFPFTSHLPDKRGFQVFTLLHIPLFALIFWAASFTSFQIGFNIFLIVHVGLHYLFRNHPQNEFDNWLSQFLIVGVVPFSILHLILLGMQ